MLDIVQWFLNNPILFVVIFTILTIISLLLSFLIFILKKGLNNMSFKLRKPIFVYGIPKCGKDIHLCSYKKKIKLNMYQLQFILFEMCRLQHEFILEHEGQESSLINSIIEVLYG